MHVLLIDFMSDEFQMTSLYFVIYELTLYTCVWRIYMYIHSHMNIKISKIMITCPTNENKYIYM